VLAALLHSVLAVETAAEEGRKVILVMLATGGVFICVIALGELTHWLRHRRP
jgi:NhaP-type Na+/H+ or K+/H+ antiporter